MTPQQERAAALKDQRIHELTAEHTEGEMTLILAGASAMATCDLIYHELQTPRAVDAMNDIFNTAISMTALVAGFKPEEDDDRVGELLAKARELVNEINEAATSHVITADNVIQMP